MDGDSNRYYKWKIGDNRARARGDRRGFLGKRRASARLIERRTIVVGWISWLLSGATAAENDTPRVMRRAVESFGFYLSMRLREEEETWSSVFTSIFSLFSFFFFFKSFIYIIVQRISLSLSNAFVFIHLFRVIIRIWREKKKKEIIRIRRQRFAKAEQKPGKGKSRGKEFLSNGSWNSINEPLPRRINALSLPSIALIIRLDQHSSSLLPRSRDRMMEHTRARAYVCATDPLREPRTLYRNGGIGRPWTRQRSGESRRGMPRGHHSIRECRFTKERKINLRSSSFSSFASRVERDRSNETVEKSSLWALNAISNRSLRLFLRVFKNTRTVNRDKRRVEWIL